MSDSQKAGIRNTVIALVGFMALLLGLLVNKMLQPRVLSIEEMVNSGAIMFSEAREIEPLSLLDQNNESFSNDRFQGVWTLVFFGFTHCPDICPTTMAQMAQMWEYLDAKPKQDLQVVMLSVDPFRDTVEKMGQYVPYFNQEFIGLTGNLRTIADLGAQLNIAFDIINPDTAPEHYDVAHSGNIVLVSPEGHYQGFFKPPFDPAILKLNYQSVWVQN